MLCSHRKKFIYLKTVKTAGTSSEIFFEKYCCPPERYQETHATAEIISEDGIIGLRWQNGAEKSGFYNHMPATLVRSRLGEEVWRSYFKFCVMRNPYDKVVSMFWMKIADEERARLVDAPFAAVRASFAEFVSVPQRLPRDRHVFMIDDRVAVDFFIRFEALEQDILEVCRRLDIDRPITALGRYKSEWRSRPEPFPDYYDPTTAKIVQTYFGWEIEAFNYELRVAPPPPPFSASSVSAPRGRLAILSRLRRALMPPGD